MAAEDAVMKFVDAHNLAGTIPSIKAKVCLLKTDADSLSSIIGSTEDHRYNDSVCYQTFCCKIEFAVVKN